jgi:hypothetical protein
VRLVHLTLLCACGQPGDDFLPTPTADATASDGGISFFGVDAAVPDVIEAGPAYNGGPFACGACTCDGTLYACLEHAATAEGGCPQGGGPPIPPSPLTGDASDDASCGKGTYCTQIPIQCLPKPTCACIEEVLQIPCDVDEGGAGFVLTCPPPPP